MMYMVSASLSDGSVIRQHANPQSANGIIERAAPRGNPTRSNVPDRAPPLRTRRGVGSCRVRRLRYSNHAVSTARHPNGTGMKKPPGGGFASGGIPRTPWGDPERRPDAIRHPRGRRPLDSRRAWPARSSGSCGLPAAVPRGPRALRVTTRPTSGRSRRGRHRRPRPAGSDRPASPRWRQ